MFKNSNKKYFFSALALVVIGLMGWNFFEIKQIPKPLITIFPLHNYDQNPSHWIDETTADYDQSLLTEEQQTIKKNEWYAHQYGVLSPWSISYVQFVLTSSSPHDLQTELQIKINSFDNTRKKGPKTGFGANFQAYEAQWLNQLKNNINLAQFKQLRYNPDKRAIAVSNIMGRELPTHEVHYYHHQIAGQGYPFDNLQASVIWAGTALYILGESDDGAWSLILTPTFIAWVNTNDIAKVDENFVRMWQHKAQQHLIAIVKTNVPIKDNEHHIHRFAGFIGTVLPGSQLANGTLRVLIPIADENGIAHIHYADLQTDEGVFLPLRPTPRNFVRIMSQLIGRPYGWGSMYFYNDCASELKNLFSPFGIWLPIHSTDQANPDYHLMKRVDLSKAKADARINYLQTKGHKFMTMVYIGGHVFLYVGTYKNPKDPKAAEVVLSYQNIWGLRPKNATEKTDRRVVIGKAVLLPILSSYPEEPELASLADKKIFQVIHLNEIPDNNPKTLHNMQALLSP